MEIEIADNIVAILTRMAVKMKENDNLEVSIPELVENAILSEYKITSLELKKADNLELDSQEEQEMLNNMKINYVYAYLNPSKPGLYQYGAFYFECEPFYIGKGYGERLNKHLEAKGKNIELNNTIHFLHKQNLKPTVIKIKECLSSAEAHMLENNLINCIGKKIDSTGPLCNLNNGMNMKIDEEQNFIMDLELNKNVNILKALNKHKNIAEAARELGISDRTLSRKKKELNIFKMPDRTYVMKK